MGWNPKNKHDKYPKPFKPSNPEKCTNRSIMLRSSWEENFVRFLDNHPSVVKWASEMPVIPYISPVDGRPHRYFMDFTLTVKGTDGKLTTYMIEVKPESQTKPPVRGRKKEQTYLTECATYAVNMAKWKAAEDYARKHSAVFKVFTEKALYADGKSFG